MNETIPPTSAPLQAKTSGLAIWSLVLSILGLMCFTIFAAIPGVICGHKALSRIKNSAGTLDGRGMAIAGLVTGYLAIAWAIIFIPLMAAIAIPNFIKARDTSMHNACVNNLRMIEAAKNEWALEKGKDGGAVPAEADLTPYLQDGKFPAFPAGAIYTINAVSNPPSCTLNGRTFQDNQTGP